MSGPTAPKDPVAKKCGFYIIRNKEIFSGVQPDGRGIQFIYLDGERLLSFTRIVGDITDSTMIDMLKTAEGFRKLVHSIGVTVTSEDKEESIDFVFQMYGKQDPYGSGTQLRLTLKGDGMENIINLNDYTWSEDDNVPGQIRFEFDKPGELAKVDVKLYLHDGFSAPEPVEETSVDTSSVIYKKMIENSLMQSGNNRRLKNAIEKAKRGEDTTIAFIGGSITQGAGATPIHTQCFAYKAYNKFCELVGVENSGHIHFIKAGVGGTPSELGMIRYERDVLRDGIMTPDIVVVEFAVNDEGDETKGECYDSLVRKILNGDSNPAVILLFSVFANDWNLQERLSPVGSGYQLPMVSLKDAVVEQFYQSSSEKILSKNQFFYDVYHPSNIGHTIMADSIAHLFQVVDQQPWDEELDDRSIDPILGGEFQNVKLLDRISNVEYATIDCGDFCNTDENLQRVEMDTNVVPTNQFPNNWMHIKGEKNFKITIRCRALLLVFKDSGEKEAGCAKVIVDGNDVFVADPQVNGWTHCNAKIVFRKEELKEHQVEIQMMPGDEDKKFTILGFGYVE